MGRRQFITLLVRSNSGWPQDPGVRHNEWVRLLMALSGMTYMLSSPSALSQEFVTQDLEAPSEQQVFKNACRTCHTIKEGDNRLGPNPYNIIGRQAGSLLDYNYSSAMKDAGFVWDKEKLGHFIAKHDEAVPGNNVKPYSGLASSDDRKKKRRGFLRSVTTARP
jgi:cytochrome c